MLSFVHLSFEYSLLWAFFSLRAPTLVYTFFFWRVLVIMMTCW